MHSNRDDADEAFVMLCNALGDKVSFGIIKSTIKAAKSVVEISRENNIPISSVYKKIRRLKSLDMIDVQTVVTDAQSGKKVAYYRCNIKSIEMSMDGYGAKMQLKLNEEHRRNGFSKIAG